MDKVFLGAQLLKRLNYIQDGIDKYNRGQLHYSGEIMRANTNMSLQ